MDGAAASEIDAVGMGERFRVSIGSDEAKNDTFIFVDLSSIEVDIGCGQSGEDAGEAGVAHQLFDCLSDQARMQMEALPFAWMLQQGKPDVTEKCRHGLCKSDETGAAQAFGARRKEGLKAGGCRSCRGPEGGVVGVGSRGGDGARVFTELRSVVVLNAGNGGGEREAERTGVFAEQVYRSVFGKGLNELPGVLKQLMLPEAEIGG